MKHPFSAFVILLTILFIGLKVTNQIDWTWVWVLSPVLVWFGLFAVAFVLAVVVVLLEESLK